MIIHVSKNNDGIFQELTKNTLVICDGFGFQVAKEIFYKFKETQDGSSEYDYHFEDVNDLVVVEDVSETHFILTINEQKIRVIQVITMSDVELLKTFDYLNEDIWLCNVEGNGGQFEIRSFTEYKDIECYQNNFKRFVTALVSGRFNFSSEEMRKYFSEMVERIWKES